jgi:hypothetical protein
VSIVFEIAVRMNFKRIVIDALYHSTGVASANQNLFLAIKDNSFPVATIRMY